MDTTADDGSVNGDHDDARRRWGQHDTPRVRHITGIRIHQLTLPESLSYASKLVPETQQTIPEDYTLGESSRFTASPEPAQSSSHGPRPRTSSSGSTALRRDRKTSGDSLFRPRSSSSSTVTLEPSSPVVGSMRTPRIARHRAPTLAGEALELGHTGAAKGSSAPDRLHGSLSEEQEMIQVDKRRLARCFVVLKLPPQPEARDDKKLNCSATKRANEELLYRTRSNTQPRSASKPASPTSRSPTPKTPSSPNSIKRTVSLPGSDGTMRVRTSSLTSQASLKSPSSPFGSPRRSDLNRTQKGSLRTAPKTRLPLPRAPSSSSSLPPLSASMQERPQIPFYISSIHPPSVFPRFTSLDPESDFAPWLGYGELASGVVEVEVWVQDGLDFQRARKGPEKGQEAGEGWKKLKGVGGLVDLGRLKKKKDGAVGSPNGIEFTLSFDPNGIYYVPLSESLPNDGDEEKPVHKKRETRLKQGTGAGGLHQLVNLHAVIVDTQKSIKQVQGNVDRLLKEDVDHRALKREVSERENRVAVIKKMIEDVEQRTEEVRTRTSTLTTSHQTRRSNLSDADEYSTASYLQVSALSNEITSLDSERLGLQPKIHKLRAFHIQMLDSLFPIQILDPSILLYTIVGVPLPIPANPKDPAPPLTLPNHKIDERTTSSALALSAHLVQLLANLSGLPGGGLPYPITCAGSKSAVRDVVSVMQGARNFPLFARGVERYRYEYGVFLLNKDIEMLMQEANIRLLDLRQTLPNLKTLLLTLSSPSYIPAPHRLPSTLGSGSGGRSRSSTSIFGGASRETSGNWATGNTLPSGPGSWGISPSSSTGVGGGRESPLSFTAKAHPASMGGHAGSPLAKTGLKGRRSMLGKATREVDLGSAGSEGEEEGSGDEEEEKRVGDGVKRHVRRLAA
ncbi:hypothetical protein B9479_004587 [Cryptococcus floricola]|uniref:Autophagy-related protein 14 n=1 Tax=Cryptococcus floricola TaxID=2591691 RepID=A0A5D3AWU6_9TREE|nr:hypothetical protein B9479_004587 [Cryptococcus floricola]